MSQLETFLQWLGRRRIAAWAALVGVLLALPSVFTGLRTEDYYHFRAIRDGVVDPPARVNLFNYISGNVSGIYGLKDFGTIPWFTLKDYKVSFWRPLTSFTHWVDYHYFPESPWLAHLQSLAWYALLILAAAALYRRLLAVPWLVALATLLYAIDDAHAHPVGWLANRNAILATLCGVFSIWAHDVWRRSGQSALTRGAAAIVAPLGLGVGFLCGEFAVGALGYLAAHALWLEPRGKTRATDIAKRAAVLLPSLAAFGVWLYYYRRLGHGTYGTDFHLDPIADTGRFLSQSLWRLPALIAGQLFGVDCEAWWRLPPSVVYSLAAVVSALVAAFLWWLRPTLRDPAARFWLFGALLATLPACAAMPQDRLLFFTGLGGMAIVALAVRQAIEQTKTATSPRHLAGRVVAFALLLVHGVVAPMTFPQRSLIMYRFGNQLDRVSERLMWSHPNSDEHLVLIGGPSYFYVASLLGLRATRNLRVPRHIRMLHAGRGPVTLKRQTEQQLVLEAPYGFYSDPFDGTYRGHQYPMEVGEGLQLAGMLIIVRAVDTEGVPTRIEVNLQRPVKRGNYHFMSWVPPKPGDDYGQFLTFKLPEVGGSVELPSGY
ncbi:MAG: hypothetical protein H6718_06860 [Polyangiaceae bacterium]|nr:hypothetical protein [Myxococcales bacterium]MCB9585099.1 hypothetical protein [Polyangiaceae bacterium]